jgi:hypothetical protein
MIIKKNALENSFFRRKEGKKREYKKTYEERIK